MGKNSSEHGGCLLLLLVIFGVPLFLADKFGIPVGATATIAVFLFVAVCILMTKRLGVKTETMRGMDFIPAKAFQKRAAQLLKSDRAKPGIKIHPQITIERGAETEHISVIGTTGAGKTKGILNRIYAEAAGRGDKVILWDVKGDFTESLATKDGVQIVAPWDSRSLVWDIAADITRPDDCDMLAESAIPDGADDKEQFFRKQARAVFSALLQCLWNENRLTWGNLASCIYDQDETLALLSQYRSGQQVVSYIEREGGQSQATWTTMLDSVGKWIAKAERAWPSDGVSFRQWLTDDTGGTLILRYSPEHPALSGALCAMVTSLLIDALLTLPEDESRAVWFIMDEMANFPKVGNLKRGVTLARDRGGRFVVSAQDVTQLFPIYGKEVSKTILNQCNTQIWLRANDEENAKIASGALGNKEEKVTKTSESGKNKMDIGSFSTSQDLRTVPVVEPGEIMALKHAKNIKGGGADGFFKMSGVQAITRLEWPLVIFEKTGPSVVQASWVTEREKPIAQNV